MSDTNHDWASRRIFELESKCCDLTERLAAAQGDLCSVRTNYETVQARCTQLTERLAFWTDTVATNYDAIGEERSRADAAEARCAELEKDAAHWQNLLRSRLAELAREKLDAVLSRCAELVAELSEVRVLGTEQAARARTAEARCAQLSQLRERVAKAESILEAHGHDGCLAALEALRGQ